MLRPILCAALLLAAISAQAADDPAIAEVRTAWQACSDFLALDTDDWMGWRHVYDGGYADFFEFYDNGTGPHPSVLERTFLIDAIATEQQTFCFRTDGTLAFVFARMTSPNMAEGFDSPAITREGRIYVAPDGQVIRVLGKITGENIDTTLADPRYQLARGCWDLDLPLTLDHARTAYLHEIGDIDGSKPEHAANLYDWCAAAE